MQTLTAGPKQRFKPRNSQSWGRRTTKYFTVLIYTSTPGVKLKVQWPDLAWHIILCGLFKQIICKTNLKLIMSNELPSLTCDLKNSDPYLLSRRWIWIIIYGFRVIKARPRENNVQCSPWQKWKINNESIYRRNQAVQFFKCSWTPTQIITAKMPLVQAGKLFVLF